MVVCSSKNREWVRRAADKAGCAHVYTLDDRSGTLLDAAGGPSQRFETVARGGRTTWPPSCTRPAPPAAAAGAMLSHGNLASNARVLHQYWGWRADDVLLHMLPIFHVHGLPVAPRMARCWPARA